MSVLDELLAPCNFPPCDPLRGEAERELEALRASHSAALSAIEAAREQGWREGGEAAAQACEQKGAKFYEHARGPYIDMARTIRALAPPAAPQGEEPKEIKP